MTRQEFIEEVNDFYDLIEFCDEQDIDLCNRVYAQADYDAMINECLCDWAREGHWWDVLERLRNLPTGYDWYYDGDYGWEEAYFPDFKNEVIDIMDRDDAWDEEEVDEEDEDDEEETALGVTQVEEDIEPEVSAEAFFCVMMEAL